MSDICYLASLAYDSGIDPVDYAEGQILLLMKVHGIVAEARALNPASFPVFVPELTREALARRILGELMDAGWKPPEKP